MTTVTRFPSPTATQPPRRRLRLLSYNIQTGIESSRYHHYVTRSWKHVLPFPKRLANLDRIGSLLHQYDIVGLQETDAGSMRSDNVNLTEYLAHAALMPFWDDRTNRRIGRIAQHSIGFLSRIRPTQVSEHRLPGTIPGRGILMVRVGEGELSLTLLIVHLALGRRTRLRQIDFLSGLVQGQRHVVMMGDFNCQSDSPEMRRLLDLGGLREPEPNLHTYPSWRPQRNIDHILVSHALQVEDVRVLNYPYSDHLPIAMEISLPPGLILDDGETGVTRRVTVRP